MWPFSRKPEKIRTTVSRALGLLKTDPENWRPCEDTYHNQFWVLYTLPGKGGRVTLYQNGDMKISGAEFKTNRTEREAIRTAYAEHQDWLLKDAWDKRKRL